MPTTAGGSYYAATSSAASLATITKAMADAEEARFLALATDYVRLYRPANAAALTALSGMRKGDLAYQVDTDTYYRRGTSAWETSLALTPSYVEFRRASAQLIGTGAEATVLLDASPTVKRGTWGLSSGVVTVPEPGFLSIESRGIFASGGSPTLFQLRAFKNASADACAFTYQLPSASRLLSLSGHIRVAAGDTLTLKAYQNSGGSINLTENAGEPILTLRYVAAL